MDMEKNAGLQNVEEKHEENNQAECKESDVDTGVAKRVRSPATSKVQQASCVDVNSSTSKVINVANLRAGINNESTAQDDSSPSASPPRKKLISALKEKMAEEERAQRVKIAHEIAADTDFRLPDPTNEGPAPDDKSPEADLKRMEKAVKDVVQRAFWDSVRAGIESDPPRYDHAFVLLQEIKDVLINLLPTNRVTSFHKRINAFMDLDLFKQQAENDTLDVKAIATFVVDIMAAMCAPVRDDQVAALRSIEDIIDLFKEIHKVLGLMKIDIANFAIKSVRPHIQQQQFEYERSEFAKLLKNSPDGLKKTKEWISVTYQEVRNDVDKLKEELLKSDTASAPPVDSPNKQKFEAMKKSALSPLNVLKTAYTKLMSPNFNLDDLPETLRMDRARIETLRLQVDQIVLVSSVMITSCGVFGQPLVSHQAFLSKLKDILMTLTAPESDKDMHDLLDKISLQCWREAEEYTKGKAPAVERCVAGIKQTTLKEKIAALHTTHSHPVYNVLYKRTIDYLRITADILANHTATTPPNLPPPPAGVSFVASELVSMALQYAKLINLNKTIYGPFYVPIMREVMGISSSNNNSPTEPGKKLSPTVSGDKGARRKLDLTEKSAAKEGSDATKTRYKVTGSLADLD